MAELGIFSINDNVEEQKKQWLEHVYRMDHLMLVKCAADYKPNGRRSVGSDGCSENGTGCKPTP